MRKNKSKPPERPIIQLSFFSNEYLYVCPRCCYDIGYTTNRRILIIKCCPNCGQPLDWSEFKNEM